MLINELSQNLENKLGLKSLNFSDQGVLSFLFNKEFTTHIEKSTDEKTLTVYGILGHVPHHNRDETLFSLLSANLFGQQIAGATFGIDSDTKEIFLFKKFDIEHLLFDHFFDELKAFLKVQQKWTHQIKGS